MRRCLSILAVLSIPMSCILLGAARNEDATLPGAVPTIDASEYSSLQAALDALGRQGGLVRLPAGTFEIEQPLMVQSSDVCIEGAGTATHIRNVATDGSPTVVIAHPEHRRLGNDRDRELWRVRLADLRVTGNEQSGDGIVAHNVNELFLDGVTVSEHGGDGARLNYCYEDPRIIGCLITYNKRTGLNLVGCHDIVVSANQFEENRDGVRCADGFNLCMNGNCLDDHLGRGVVIENTYGSVVSGNMIEECQAAAVVLDRDCYGNTVSANVIAHNGAGVDLRDAHGCAVSANTFTIMKSDAVKIGSASGRVAVSANCFSDSYIGDGVRKRGENDRAAAGLVIVAGGDAMVHGNLFSGVGPRAITVQVASGASPSVVTDNVIVATDAGIESAPERANVVDGNRSVGAE